MQNDIRNLYLCYLIDTDGERVGTIYEFLKTPEGREYFDTYSTHNDTIKKFLDCLRYILEDERVM